MRTVSGRVSIVSRLGSIVVSSVGGRTGHPVSRLSLDEREGLDLIPAELSTNCF